jgi:threonine/homoserine/homoserine lactone efflux protein
VALGLANLLNSSPAAFLTVKIAGGLYLLYLGTIGILHRNDVIETTGDGAAQQRCGESLRSGLFSCLLNPKVGLFFLAVAPQFLPTDAISVRPIMTLGLIDAVVAFTWLGGVAIGAARAVQWLRRPKVSRTTATVSSIALGVLGILTITTVFF